MVLPLENLMALRSLREQPVGLRTADFEFRGYAPRVRTWKPTGVQPDGPTNQSDEAGRSETADFKFSGLRDQDSNLEPTG
jgi:hypothetical protein